MSTILPLISTGKRQTLLTANTDVSYTKAAIGRTTSKPVIHELLKSSNSALASGKPGYYVCIVRLIDARTNQYPEKPTNQYPEKPNQHPK
jgi:hypothetical protein